MRICQKRQCGLVGLVLIIAFCATAQQKSGGPAPTAQGDETKAAEGSGSGSESSPAANTEALQPAVSPSDATPNAAAAPTTPAAAGSAKTPAATKAPAAPSTADQVYDLKLRGLEERVNELKEKIFRTKKRILQLQETVVSGSIGLGARAVMLHRNEMGGAFRLLSVQYSLDTAPVFNKVDVDGDLDKIEEKEIYSGNIVPGDHNIAVQMIFQGRGYGFFSYMKGYKIKVTSSYNFTAEEGKVIIVKVVAFERGGITVSLEDRPTVRYDIQIEKLTPERVKSLQEKSQDSENSAEPGKTPESAKTQEPG